MPALVSAAGPSRFPSHSLSLHKLCADAVIIDDSTKYCQACAAAGMTALLFGRYGWNATVQQSGQSADLPELLESGDPDTALHPSVVRVDDWEAVLAALPGP